jgi:hypothetical protein
MKYRRPPSPETAAGSRCSGEWNDDNSTCWPMAGFGRIFEANAGRNELVCKTVLEHRAGRLLAS